MTDAALLSTFDVERMTVEALLWQTGYPTIDAEELIGGSYFYRLRYPNREVYQSLNAAVLEAWTPPSTADVHQSLCRLQQRRTAGSGAALQRAGVSVRVQGGGARA